MKNISQNDLNRAIEATRKTAEAHARLGWSFSPPSVSCVQILEVYKQSYYSV